MAADDFTFSTSTSETDPAVARTDRRRKTLFCTAIILLLAAIVSIILGVVLSQEDSSPAQSAEGNAEQTSPPTLAPTPALEVGIFTPAPTYSSNEELIRDIALFGGEEFEDPNSPQSQALAWVQIDAAGGPSEESRLGGGRRKLWSQKRIVQRYALATFFYATHNVQTTYTDALWGETRGWKTSENWMTSESECSWYSVTCDENDVVTALEPSENDLSGSLPREITLLKGLTKLDLFDNPIYNDGEDGNDWLGDLTSLQYLYFGSTNFAYEGVPTSLSKLTNLIELDFSYTLYFGALDGAAFEGLDSLVYLAMGGNFYESTVPDELASLPSLKRLYIEDAVLTGSLDFITKMPSIFELWMDYNNRLTGSIPSNLPSTLESWSCTESGLTGMLPTELGLLTGMQQMWLYNNALSGTIPTEWGNLSKMKIFHVEGNNLSGEVPEAVCALSMLDEFQTDCSSGQVACSCCSACF